MIGSFIRYPRAAGTSYTARQVATAYNFPLTNTGQGYTCGIIELGGGFSPSDLESYFGSLDLPVPDVTAVPVDGGSNSPGDPNGPDGEVLLDIEVAGSLAPGATYKVYFCPNTNDGFLAGIKQAVSECTTVSISWGGPESSWDSATLDAFDAVFLQARCDGCVVFCSAGDSGSSDGTGSATVDFPASSPNVIGCGGTKLTLASDGSRDAEVTWDENDTSSATGGGVSKHFAGRQVPDVAGNADPATGYQILVDGQQSVVGGTSAVSPLYAGLVLLLSEAVGAALGTKVDLLNTLLTNPGVCFDVTAGDNGAYRAGVGRDNVTGLGVVDGAKLLAVLTDDVADPAPLPPAAT